MTQMELQELEKQAKKGDSSAQFSFGLLLVLNNYYDEGKEFIVKSSEQQNEEALRWISIHQELTKALESVEVDDDVKGKKIDFWNLKKGYGTESFSFSPLSNEVIFIFCENKNDNDNFFRHFHTEMINEKYFHILFDLWGLYINGKIKNKDIKPTKNAKYLISILHYIIENTPTLSSLFIDES